MGKPGEIDGSVSMKRIFICVLLILEAVVLAACLYICLRVPARIRAVPSGVPYEGDEIDASFFNVKVTSLFGREVDADVSVDVSKGAADYTAVFSSGDLQTTSVVKFIPVKKITASYAGTLYAGDPVAPSALSTRVFYADGTDRDVDISAFLPERLYEPFRSSLSTPYGSVELFIDVIRVTGIVPSYSGEIYPDGELDSSLLRANVVFEDGSTVQTKDLSFVDEIYAVGRTDYPVVSTKYGEVPLEQEPHKIDSLSLTYKGTVYEGEPFLQAMIDGMVTFDDGTTKAVYSDKLFPDGLDDITAVTKSLPSLKTPYGEAKLEAVVTKVDSASFIDPGEWYDGDIPTDTLRILMTYEDSHEKEVSAGDVEWTVSPFAPLDEGVNTFTFLWCGRPHSLALTAMKATVVHRASQKYASEFLSADHTYLSDHTFVTVTHYVSDSQEFDLAHVVIDSPSQLRAGLSHDTYGGTRERATDASLRLNWAVGINASMFSYETNRPIAMDARIKWGQVMFDSKDAASGFEIALTKSGRLFQPQQGMSVKSLLSMGVTDTFGYGDPAFLVNGHRTSICDTNRTRYPHTVIAMVKPSEYYFLTTSTGNYTGGSTYAELADFFIARGCEFGACLDGGGSSSLVMDDMLLNRPSGGGERPVVDFIYVVDALALSDDELFSEAGLVLGSDDGISIEDEIRIHDVTEGITVAEEDGT